LLINCSTSTNMNALETYKIINLEKTDTPFFAVYPDVVKKNIQRLIDLFPSKDQIRPHVKTHKCPQIVKLLLDAGITKFKCATIAEADMLGLSGADDILMAYQPVGPKIKRFINLIVTFPNSTFSCLIDNEKSAQQLSDAALKIKRTVNVWIDLNVGMNRTGIAPDTDAEKLFLFCSELSNLKILGLHAYDGHITDADKTTRFEKAGVGFEKVKKLENAISNLGFDDIRIAAGSTPTIQFYSQQKDVECSPGTFIYWDQHYRELYPELGFRNAAIVVTRIISKPSTDAVCLDLGYKAISSESAANERVYFPYYPGAEVLSQSEEHLLANLHSTSAKVGDVIYGLPFHIGRTCNLYEGCAVVEGHQIIDKWLHTARRR
jgi:D-serine deaminase-like pyridoxal phosphate-dependent protein